MPLPFSSALSPSARRPRRADPLSRRLAFGSRLAGWIACGLIVACGTAPATPHAVADPSDRADADHAREVEEWRAERSDRLRSPDGWLSLAGLHWLEPGRHAVGSGDDARVELPASAPARIGELIVEAEGAERFRFVPAAGLAAGTLELGGAPLAADAGETVLRSDMQGAPTRIGVGSIVFFMIERSGRVGVRVKDSESEVLRGFEGIDNFPIRPEWRVEARYEPYDPPKRLMVPSVLGVATEEEVPGAVLFERDGSTHRLDVLEGGDEREIFVLFADDTNGLSTYGGGRFLYAHLSAELDAAGPVVLDFNKSYNPPCAFTPYATCPLPPPENRLDLAIPAGEKSYGEAH